jgi:hypothetical protein
VETQEVKELIGLSGYARSGKDEAAKVLVEEFGFTRVAFADKLRDVLYQLNPIIDVLRANVPLEIHTIHGRKRLMQNATDPATLPVSTSVFLQDIIDRYGWNGYKETQYGTEIRRLLQRLGTEAGRQTLWDSIWVDAALTGHDEDAKIVVTDCRFPNEAQAIKDGDGYVWRVKREGVGPANSHPSETSLDDWPFDCWIDNAGSLEEYHETIRKAYAHFNG